jgi:hypothetical protein
MANSAIGLDQINALTGGRFGVVDAGCPICGPFRRSAQNQRRKTLRIWRDRPDFVTFSCARCLTHGFARSDTTSPPPDPAERTAKRAAAAEHHRIHQAQRLDQALWLWRRREPVVGSPVERYLRESRGYRGPLPATLG